MREKGNCFLIQHVNSTMVNSHHVVLFLTNVVLEESTNVVLVGTNFFVFTKKSTNVLHDETYKL